MQSDLEKAGVSIVDPTKFTELAKSRDKSLACFFFLPWCGHCKTAKPEYIKFSRAADSSKTTVVAMNGDSHGRWVYQEFGINMYPSIVMIDTSGKRHFPDGPPFAEISLSEEAKKYF